MGLTLTGCGGGSSGDAQTGASTSTGTSTSTDTSTSTSTSTAGTVPTGTATGDASSPQISGNAPTVATVGQLYSFKPQASDPDNGALTFTIANKPAWAAFNATTGQLSGTPAASDVGQNANIQIAVTDGTSVSTLAAFTITVAEAGATQAVTLAWTAPTTNSDGTPLTDLGGYEIHYGATSKQYTGTIDVDNPGVTQYVVQSLPAGTYYFALTAYNTAGTQSAYSDEVQAQIQ